MPQEGDIGQEAGSGWDTEEAAGRLGQGLIVLGQ